MPNIPCEICGTVTYKSPNRKAKHDYCSNACRAVGIRLEKQREVEERFRQPIKDLLADLYHVQRMGIRQIAKHLGVSDSTTWIWLDDLGIERRERSDAVAAQWEGNDERRDRAAEQIRRQMDEGIINLRGEANPAKRPEVRQKISEMRRGVNNPMYGRRSATHPNWKGGRSKYRGRDWKKIRRQIRRRDQNRCMRCGGTEHLQVHHITPYEDSFDNSPQNLITLCARCHGLVEHGTVALPSEDKSVV